MFSLLFSRLIALYYFVWTADNQRTSDHHVKVSDYLLGFHHRHHSTRSALSADLTSVASQANAQQQHQNQPQSNHLSTATSKPANESNTSNLPTDDRDVIEVDLSDMLVRLPLFTRELCTRPNFTHSIKILLSFFQVIFCSSLFEFEFELAAGLAV